MIFSDANPDLVIRCRSVALKVRRCSGSEQGYLDLASKLAWYTSRRQF